MTFLSFAGAEVGPLATGTDCTSVALAAGCAAQLEEAAAAAAAHDCSWRLPVR